MKHSISSKERIQDMIINLFVDYHTSFYGYFLLQFHCVPVKPEICATMGVTLTNQGVVMVYNSKFLETLSDQTLEFILIHEMMHVVHSHVKQNEYFGNHALANIARDAVINTDLTDLGFNMPKIRDNFPYMKEDHPFKLQDLYVDYTIERTLKNISDITPEQEILIKQSILQQVAAQGIPLNATMEEMGNKYSGVRFKPEYNGERLSFEYYLFLLEEQKKQNSNNGDGNGKNSKGNDPGESGNGSSNGNYSGGINHSHDEITAEKLKEALKGTDLEKATLVEDHELGKNLVENMLETAKQKARGNMPGKFEEILNGLRKTKKNYLKQILQGITFVSGSVKQETYKRESRREIEGLKGNKKYARKINVILDTSGSMYKEFDKCLSILFSRGITCNLIQVDTEVKSVDIINSDADLRRVAIKGMGGTYLTPAIEYIEKTPKLKMYNTVIMTDGYTETLDCSKLKRTLVLTTEAIPQVLGNTRVVKIDK